MHRLLERQLKKYFGSLDNIPEEWKAVLEDISVSYQEADQERAALQNTLEGPEKPQRATPRPARPTPGYRYQGNVTESANEPTIETQQAWTKGKTVIRRGNLENKDAETRIAVPIKIRDQTLGALNLSFADNESAQQTLPLLEQLSARLALAMDNARLFSETQSSLARTEALFQVSRSAIAFEDLPDLMQSLVNSVAATLPADRVSLTTFDVAKEQITNFYAGGPGADQVVRPESFKELQAGLSGWVIREQKLAPSPYVGAGLSPKDAPDPRESAAAQQRRREFHGGSVLVVPLLYRNAIIGTLTAINTPEQPDFTEQDSELMMAMASQAATAIENARLFQAQQQRAAELQAASEVSHAASSILDLDELLAQSVEVIRERFGLYYVGIFLVDATGDWAELRAGTGEAGRIQIERQHKLRVGGESMIGQCVSISAARISQDVGDETLRFRNPVLPETRSEMALPLMSRGQTIGAMTIQSIQPLAFNPENITTLQTMADQLANAILNAQLFAQTQARATELASLNEMARSLTETLDVNAIVEQVYQFSSRLMDTANFYLALYYPEQDEIEFKLYTIEGKRVTVRDQRRKAGKGLTEHVIRTRRPLYIEENVDEFINNLTGIEAIGRSAECWLGVPMLAGNQAIGMINVQNYESPFYFTPQQQQLLFAVASQAAIAIQNARLFEQTQRQNQELGLLNEMGGVLNTFLERDAILEKVYEYTSRLVNFSTFLIGWYHAEQEEISIPLVIEKGQRLSPQRFPRQGGLLDYIIRTRTPLLLTDNVNARAKELGIEIPVVRTTGEALESWVGAPIQVGNTVIGVLSIQSTTPQVLFVERHRDLLTSIANLAANALENARLFEQTQLQNQELAVLNEMGRVLNALLDRDKIIESVFVHTSQLIEFTSFLVALYNAEKDEISFPFVTEKGEQLTIPPTQGTNSLLGYVIRTKTPLLVPENLDAYAAELGIQMRVVGKSAKSWLAVPILLGNTVAGAISVQTVVTPRLYTERHRDLMISIANQAAIALQNAALFEQAQRQNQELAVLNEMSRVLTTLLDAEAIIAQIHIYTTRLIQTVDFFVALYDEVIDRLSFPLVVDEGQRIEVPSRPLKNSFSDYIIRNGEPVLLKTLDDPQITQMGVDQIIYGQPPQSWLGVPISIGQKVMGVITVQSTTQPNAYSERDRDLLTAIASQAAIAIQNARSFEQTVRRSEDLTTLNEMGRVLSNILEVEQILDRVYEFSSKLFDTTTFLIALYDAEKEELTFPLAVNSGERMPPRTRPLGSGLTDHVIRTRKPLLLPDNVSQRGEELGIKLILFGDDRIAQCWLGVPITLGNTMIGVISVQSLTTPHLYNTYHRDLLISIASQTATTLQNAQLFQQTQAALSESTEQARRLAVLNQMSAQLTQATDLDEVFTQAAVYISQIYKAARVSFSLLVSDHQVEIRAIYGEQTEFQVGQRLSLAGTANESAIIENRIVIVTDTKQTSADAIRSFMAAPITVEGRVIGTLNVGSLQPNDYHSRDENLLQQVVSLLGTLITNRQLFALAEQRAQEAHQRSEELALVNRVVSRVSEAFDLLEGLNIVSQELGVATDAGRVGVALLNEEETELKVVAEYRLETDPSAIGLIIPVKGNPSTQRVLETKKSLFIQEAQSDPLLAPLHEAFRERKILSLVILPLMARGKVVGTIGLDILEKGRTFTQDQLRLAEAVVLQASTAIYNTQLYAQTQQRAAQLLTAAEIARSASETLAQDELLYRAVNLVRDRFNFYHASVFLLDDSRQWAVIQESTGEAGAEMKRRGHQLEVGSQSIIGTVTITGNPLIVNDVTKDGVHRPNPLLPDTKAEMGIPLKLGRRVIGALDVQSTEVDAFTPDDVAVLQILADQIAIAVDNSRSYTLARESIKEANERVEEISVLFEISQSLASAPLLTEEIAEIIASKIIQVLGGSSTCGLSLYEAETDMMRVLVDVTYVDGKNQFLEEPGTWDFKLSDFPASKKVLETLQPLVIQADDQEADPNELEYLAQVGAETLLIIPLAAKGQAFGLIEIESWEKKRQYTPDQINLALTVANQGAAAMDNARLYEQQLKTAEQLREVDKLKNQFLANMSHELRTPLNSIIGFSRVILKGIDGPISDLQEQDLSAIYNAGTHLLGLINDILDISRIEAGKMELSFEEVDMAHLITSVMATAKGLLKEKPVRLETYFEPHLPLVKADPTRMRQIILNLLQNATKFTDEGSINVNAVRQINASGKPEVMVSVTDTGVGIAPKDQKKLFQPFSQVDASPTRKAGGTGLGLSITRNLIELHDGQIDVISDVDKGSTFFFTIPAIAQTGSLTDPIRANLPDQNSGLKIVLAIEDDPHIIQLYQRYLEPEGYQVIPLTDSTKAVQQAQVIQPFAITLDVHMPNLDGWQVMKALKSIPETRSIPVIFCTIVENQAKGYSLGAADYLMKPILGEDLVNALTRLESETEIKHILVIDDDLDDLRLVEKALQLSGTYQIRLAQGGKKGLDAMQRNKPDAVILDLSMPDVDGFKVLEIMRADKHLKDTPVIILTALDLTTDQQKLLSEYTQDQLRKGFLEADGLLACLQQTLKTTRLQPAK